MVDDCNSMIHQPFSGTGFQSLPKVTNPEEVWKDPKNNSQENLLGKLKKGVWTWGCIWKPMQNYPNDSSLLGHLQKQLTKNSLSINRPEKSGKRAPVSNLSWHSILKDRHSKNQHATTSKRYSWNFECQMCITNPLEMLRKGSRGYLQDGLNPGFGRKVTLTLETDTMCETV